MLIAGIAMAVAGTAVFFLTVEKKENRDACSVPVFFRRYKWYCVSLLGVMLLGMFHAMTENYLIEIVTPLGGL